MIHPTGCMIGARCALLGDAAVGMHPVTAHGFNFGLLGVQLLSDALLAAHHKQQDIGATAPLAHYERQLRLAQGLLPLKKGIARHLTAHG